MDWLAMETDEDVLNEMYDTLHDTYGYMLGKEPNTPNYAFKVIQLNSGFEKLEDLKDMEGNYSFLINYAYQRHLEMTEK